MPFGKFAQICVIFFKTFVTENTFTIQLNSDLPYPSIFEITIDFLTIAFRILFYAIFYMGIKTRCIIFSRYDTVINIQIALPYR